MKRPIGVTILAALAGLAGLANLWRVGVYMGWFKFDIFGTVGVQLQDANWGAALWALLIAAIWFWVAAQFWNMRAAGWQFGVFISLFTLIWGFFALLFGSTVQYETIPMLLALIVYVYLNWPGVRDAFVKAETDRPDARAEGRLRAARRRPTPRPGVTSSGYVVPIQSQALDRTPAGTSRPAFSCPRARPSARPLATMTACRPPTQS